MLAEQGRIVIFQRGRYTGHKAIIINSTPTSILVVGASKVPKPINEHMTERAKKRRSKMQAFIKVMNPKHLIFTRYTSNIELGFEIDASSQESKKTFVKKVEDVLRKAMDEKNNEWLFKKLIV